MEGIVTKYSFRNASSGTDYGGKSMFFRHGHQKEDSCKRRLVNPGEGSVAMRQSPHPAHVVPASPSALRACSREKHLNVGIFLQKTPHHRTHFSPHCRTNDAQLNSPCLTATNLFHSCQRLIRTG
jgi:hypothetical protein